MTTSKGNAALAGAATVERANGSKVPDQNSGPGSNVKTATVPLVPIVERIERKHHWRIADRPCHVEEPLTDACIAAHLNGGPKRGACPIERGTSTTRLALLDLDSHKGESTWQQMADAAGEVLSALEQHDLRATPVRSTGGNGIHLYVLWDAPQDAYSVRSLLADVLADCLYRNGTGGVAAGEIEVFPKQDEVPAAGCGNMFVLPFAGRSVPLDPLGFEPIALDAVRWPLSADVPVRERPQRVAAVSKHVDADRLRALLADHDPSCDYDTWNMTLARIHDGSGGEDWGLELAVEWSDPAWQVGQSTYASCYDEIAAKWASYGNHPKPATVAGLRVDKAASVDDFEVVEPAPPIIELKAGELHKYAVQAEELLSGEVYTRSNKLVRVGGASEIKGQTFKDAAGKRREVERPPAQPVIIGASAEFLQRRLGEVARIVAFNAKEGKLKRKDCPKELANNIAGQGEWQTLKPLEAIASAPFIRPDLSICTMPGYDPQTAVYFVPNADFPAIPEAPTQKQGAKALALLLAPFAEFPYASSAARSAFVSHILTEAVRVALSESPLYWYTAPEAGTGKTLLAEMPARIVHGHMPAQSAWAEGDEMRKVLFASLLAGDRSIAFDNVTKGIKVRSKNLAAFATAPVYKDRKLGVSEAPAVPNKSVVSLGGINITPVGELARRSVVVRLDADADSTTMRERRFAIRDLRAYVAAHRAELLTAALTVARAFVAAGCPEQSNPLPTFEQWSRLARDPLLWLGLDDPLDTQAVEADDETGTLNEVFRLLGEKLAGKEFETREITEACDGLDGDGGLRAALARSGCSDPGSPRLVGYWLRDNRDRNAGGYKLVNRRIEGRRLWRFLQRITSCAGSDLV